MADALAFANDLQAMVDRVWNQPNAQAMRRVRGIRRRRPAVNVRPITLGGWAVFLGRVPVIFSKTLESLAGEPAQEAVLHELALIHTPPDVGFPSATPYNPLFAPTLKDFTEAEQRSHGHG